jgi:hypothetical protein
MLMQCLLRVTRQACRLAEEETRAGLASLADDGGGAFELVQAAA